VGWQSKSLTSFTSFTCAQHLSLTREGVCEDQARIRPGNRRGAGSASRGRHLEDVLQERRVEKSGHFAVDDMRHACTHETSDANANGREDWTTRGEPSRHGSARRIASSGPIRLS